METASGHVLPNQGQVTLDLETREKLRSSITFQNVKVITPILSVRKLVRKGHRVEFWKGGGNIIAAGDGGHRMAFVERNGVYYIRMKFLPPANDASSGFSRQG